MRKFGLWVVKTIHVLAVLWLSCVGGGLLMSKNSTPSESNLGFWVTVGAVAVAVFGVRLIYGKNLREPLKATLLGAFMVWFISAILTPVFQSAREAAPQFACLSNFKQMATGTQIYLADSDDVYPKAESWHDQLTPYVRADYQCREARTKFSYGMNTALGAVPFAKIKSPEKTVLFFEMDSEVPNAHGTAKDAVARHRGMFIIATADGAAYKDETFPAKWILQ